MMQTWSMAWTLKIWQVKTICPCGWSEADGEGMEVWAPSTAAAGVAVKKLYTGVAPGGVAACGVTFAGVEA